MEFEVVQFKLHTNAYSIGKCLISYGNLLIDCELAYYKPENKAWLRMPERWVFENNKRVKERYCFWNTKEESDKFQQEILKIIYERYDLSLDQIALLDSQRRVTKKKIDSFVKSR